MLLWVTPAYRPVRIPIFACHACGNRADLAVCTTCGEKVCPSCRCGTGSLEDGYECLSHYRSTAPNETRSLPRAPKQLPWFALGCVWALCIILIVALVVRHL
jgi:hypothetical protein